VQEAAQNSFLYRSAFGMQKPGGLLANILDIHLVAIAITSHCIRKMDQVDFNKYLSILLSH
jgi:hypothetical protein